MRLKQKIGLALIGLACLNGMAHGAEAVEREDLLEAKENEIGTFASNEVYGARYAGQANINIGPNKSISIKQDGDPSSGLIAHGLMVEGNAASLTPTMTVDIDAGATIESQIYGDTAGDTVAVGVTVQNQAELTMHGGTISAKGVDSAIGIQIKSDASFVGEAGTLVVSASATKDATGILASGYEIDDLGERIEKQASIHTGKNLVVSAHSAEGDATGILLRQGAVMIMGGGELSATQGEDMELGNAIVIASGAELSSDAGKYTIRGNIVNQLGPSGDNEKSGGTINLYMKDGSSFEGQSVIEEENGEKGITNFYLTDTRWDMTGDSQVTTLDFNGQNSQVHFLYAGENKGFKTLTVENLSGTGYFQMNTDLRSLNLTDSNRGAGISGDLLVVEEDLSGSHLVSVTNRGDATATGDEILTIIQTGDAAAKDYFQLTNQVEFGGYLYDLKEVENQTNHLALQATGKITNPGKLVNLHAGNYMMHNAELQTLMKRLGDLRGGTDASQGGNVWGRVYGGKMHSNSDGVLGGFDMNYRGIQVGADRRHDRTDGRGTTYVGGFFGYTDGDLDYSGGHGDTDSLSLGGYWTHIHPNGFYADLVLKYSNMKSEYDIVDSAGRRLMGRDIKSDVFSLSMEVGRRYFFDTKDQGGVKIPVEAREGFYIEPQAQVTVSHFSGDSFKVDNGLHTRVGAFQSTIARVGTHLGYESKSAKNPMNFYVKGYFMKEFDGNIDFTYNGGKRHTTSYEDTWFVYGLGATAKLGERHNLYLDFERWTGGRMEQDWAVNGGYRYSW